MDENCSRVPFRQDLHDFTRIAWGASPAAIPLRYIAAGELYRYAAYWT